MIGKQELRSRLTVAVAARMDSTVFHVEIGSCSASMVVPTGLSKDSAGGEATSASEFEDDSACSGRETRELFPNRDEQFR